MHTGSWRFLEGPLRKWCFDLCFLVVNQGVQRRQDLSYRTTKPFWIPIIISYCWWKHQLMSSLPHYLQGFIHLRWLFGISSITSYGDSCSWTDIGWTIYPYATSHRQVWITKCPKVYAIGRWLARKKDQGIQKGLTPDGGPSPKRPLDHLLANHFSGSRFFFGFEQGLSKYHPNIYIYIYPNIHPAHISCITSPKKNDKLLNFEAGGYATFHQNLHISSIIVVLLTQLAGMPRHSGVFFAFFWPSAQFEFEPLVWSTSQARFRKETPWHQIWSQYIFKPLIIFPPSPSTILAWPLVRKCSQDHRRNPPPPRDVSVTQRQAWRRPCIEKSTSP